MRHSQVDRRAKRYAPVQSLSDTGHKDAPSRLGKPTRPQAIRRLIKQALAEKELADKAKRKK